MSFFFFSFFVFYLLLLLHPRTFFCRSIKFKGRFKAN